MSTSGTVTVVNYKITTKQKTTNNNNYLKICFNFLFWQAGKTAKFNNNKQ